MKESKISAFDWYILRTLWEYGSLTPKEINNKSINERECNINTLRTLLSRLLKKVLFIPNSFNYSDY